MSHSHSHLPISRTYSGKAGLRYRACRPDEILIKSGMGITTEMISKKTFHWPFQRVTVVSLAPRNYSFILNCISSDMVPFELPVTFIIGPHDFEVDPDGFRRYCVRMSAMTSQELEDLVLGFVWGQTRLYAASLSVMQMFNDRDSFKSHVQERIQKEVVSFGLMIFNANISEMKDKPGNAYFESLKQKAISGAINDARIATAEAQKKGDIGECERQAEAKIRLSQIQANVTAAENLRKQEIEKSNLQLQLVKLDCGKQQENEKIQTDMQPKKARTKLQTELNQLEGLSQTEYLKSTKLADATVAAEGEVRMAQGKKKAQIELADAKLYEEQKRAEGMNAVAAAQSEALTKFLQLKDPDMIKYFLALEKDLYPQMADKTAEAIRGLAPKINIWNTDPQSNESGEYSGLRKLFTSLPPMLDAVQTQTGLRVPGVSPSTS